jgi:hypothetical protein
VCYVLSKDFFWAVSFLPSSRVAFQQKMVIAPSTHPHFGTWGKTSISVHIRLRWLYTILRFDFKNKLLLLSWILLFSLSGINSQLSKSNYQVGERDSTAQPYYETCITFINQLREVLVDNRLVSFFDYSLCAFSWNSYQIWHTFDFFLLVILE